MLRGMMMGGVLAMLLFSCSPCKNKNCQNNGTCVEGKCVCTNPYTGEHCETDACSHIACLNGGNCYFGDCKCASGYEGKICDTLVTKKFLGNYTYRDSCNGSSVNSSTSITATGQVANRELIIRYVHGYDAVAVATGRNLTISSQALPNGNTISGTGELSSDYKTLTLNLTFTPFGGTAYSCRFVLKK